MRLCVAKYGAAGATFDHVAREAGVSRGLLHYYFGSKEKLLIEVVRSETARLVELIKAAATAATSAEELVDIFLAQLQNIIEHEPELYLLGFELIGEARRHPEIGNEVGEYNRPHARAVRRDPRGPSGKGRDQAAPLAAGDRVGVARDGQRSGDGDVPGSGGRSRRVRDCRH